MICIILSCDELAKLWIMQKSIWKLFSFRGLFRLKTRRKIKIIPANNELQPKFHFPSLKEHWDATHGIAVQTRAKSASWIFLGFQFVFFFRPVTQCWRIFGGRKFWLRSITTSPMQLSKRERDPTIELVEIRCQIGERHWAMMYVKSA